MAHRALKMKINYRYLIATITLDPMSEGLDYPGEPIEVVCIEISPSGGYVLCQHAGGNPNKWYDLQAIKLLEEFIGPVDDRWTGS
jgi:hypothetical protein